jgi:hypothetical protein
MEKITMETNQTSQETPLQYNELCEICKDYDDTWTINDFCSECKKKLSKSNGEII